MRLKWHACLPKRNNNNNKANKSYVLLAVVVAVVVYINSVYTRARDSLKTRHGGCKWTPLCGAALYYRLWPAIRWHSMRIRTLTHIHSIIYNNLYVLYIMCFFCCFFFTIDKRKQNKRRSQRKQRRMHPNYEFMWTKNQEERVAITKGQHNGQLAKSFLLKTVCKRCSHTHTHRDRWKSTNT